MKRTLASGLATLISLKQRLFWAMPIALAMVMLAMAAVPLSGPTSYDATRGISFLVFAR